MAGEAVKLNILRGTFIIVFYKGESRLWET